jgi:predicted transcriptional regulator
VDSTLWADAFSDNLRDRGLNARTRSGVLSSLNKKGYIISRSGNRNAVLMLTEKGKEYIKTTFNIA